MCMYIYIHMYIHTYIHTYTHTHSNSSIMYKESESPRAANGRQTSVWFDTRIDSLYSNLSSTTRLDSLNNWWLQL